MQELSVETKTYISSMISKGYTTTEIADRSGVSRASVHRLGGSPVRREPLRTHREAIQSMTASDACEYLLGVIETLDGEPRRDVMLNLVVAGFTPQESLVVDYLSRREGRPCSRLMIYEMLIIGKPESKLPAEKLVDVLVCKIRKKLPAGASIKTIWAMGYSFERAPGTVLPWESHP